MKTLHAHTFSKTHCECGKEMDLDVPKMSILGFS